MLKDFALNLDLNIQGRIVDDDAIAIDSVSILGEELTSANICEMLMRIVREKEINND